MNNSDKRSEMLNQTYNNLTVIGLSDDKKKVVCKCKCGTTKEILAKEVRYGKIKSCGCLRKNNKSHSIIVGEKYHEYTVLKDLGVKTYRNAKQHMWWCKCSCGKELERSTADLNHTKSCGCLMPFGTTFTKKNNKYDLSGEYGIGYTSRGEEFYFDLEDYDKIKDYCWSKSKGYLVSTVRNKDDKTQTNLIMHRLITNAPKGLFVDHINHKIYDNRKSNLRLVTNQQNCYNEICNNPYGMNGITKNENGTYLVRIGYNYSKLTVGTFKTLEEAIKARLEAENKYFGEYSFNNSIKMEAKNE